MNPILQSLGSLILPIFGFLIALLVTGVGLTLFALFAWHGQALYSGPCSSQSLEHFSTEPYPSQD